MSTEPIASAAPLSFTVRGPITRGDLQGLSERVCALFATVDGSTLPVVRCEVSSVAPDAVTIEALARLKLVAQRAGCSVRLCSASDELMALVAFLGLADVLLR